MGFPAAIYHQNVVLDRSVLSDLMADLLWIEPRLARGVHLCTELDNNQVRAFFSKKKSSLQIIKCVFIYDPPWTELRAR